MNNSKANVGLGLGFALSALLSSSVASAQFEGIYGATPSSDTGARGAAPVLACPGGGFISTGTQQLGGAAGNVLVVRTTAAGATAFERTYDIGGAGANDRGTSIVELRAGNGFVVSGSTTIAGNEDAFLLRIDCGGNLVWAFTYGSAGRDAALDVVEATSGNAAAGTAPGDLIATGYTSTAAGAPDGLLFRVRSNGALLWNRRYDVNNVAESFAALVEARPLGGVPTGDIVTVGSWKSGAAPDQGYVLRVSGDTGLFTVANACAAIYGGPDTDRFTSVVESRAGGTIGNLVFAGTSTAAGTANDIFVVRSQPNPCNALAQRRIGAAAGAASIDDETAADVKQLAVGLGIGPLGSFILTGAAGKSGTTSYDAHLLSLNSGTLVPLTGRLFGDHLTRRDSGTSIFDMSTIAPGVFISGTSESDFQGVGDLRDLYLIRTDATGNTMCQVGWVPPSIPVAFAPTTLSPVVGSVLAQVARPVAITGQVTGFLACP
jgi:hypothetical protein